MKILHTSDLHIGLKLMNYDLKEDQADILHKICLAAEQEKPDAVLIAGDIYDKSVPGAEAVELFDAFIAELCSAVPEAEIMVVSGNHDSPDRLNLYRGFLEKQRLHMIGLPPKGPDEEMERITLSDIYGRVHFYLLPFIRPSMVRSVTGNRTDGSPLSYAEAVGAMIRREMIDLSDRNVIVSHQFYLPEGVLPEEIERADSEIRTAGNIDAVPAAVLEPFDYAALGHIHKPMTVGKNRFRYCGTPFACSVSEAGQEKQVLCVELKEKGTVLIRGIPLNPLRKVIQFRGPLNEILGKACDDYVSVILTDPSELDSLDMMDRLRAAFPHLLQVRRNDIRRADLSPVPEEALKDPFEMILEFLKTTDEKERTLLRDVVNTVKDSAD